MRYIPFYFFVFWALLSGCGKVDDSLKKEALLRINIGGDPQNLDPRKARDLRSTTLMHMFFEGLTGCVEKFYRESLRKIS